VLVAPGENLIISVVSEVGGDPEPRAVGTFISGVLVTRPSAGDTCRKDPSLDLNWGIDSRQLHRRPASYRHDFSFDVLEGDFL
jgi:hypothetical protein